MHRACLASLALVLVACSGGAAPPADGIPLGGGDASTVEPTTPGDGTSDPDASVGDPDSGGTANRPDASPRDAGGTPRPDAGGGGGGGGGSTTNCTPIGASCVVGGGMEYCITYVNNTCSNVVYKHAGKTYSCAGCTDCTAAYGQAYVACQDAVGACNDLDACCATIQQAYKSSCMQSAASYRSTYTGEISCKSLAASYRQSNLCP